MEYKKLGFWISVLSLISMYVISNSSKTNEISINNATLTNSFIVQDSPGTSIEYIDAYDKTYIFELSVNNWEDGWALDIYSIKLILPDGQEAFIKEAVFQKKYKIACWGMIVPYNWA